jgi:membrane protein
MKQAWGIDLRWAAWREILIGLARGSKRHHAAVIAGGVAFFGFLSLFPALSAVISTYGLLADPSDVEGQVNVLAGALPEGARAVLKTEVAALTSRSSGSLSLEVVVGIVAAVWAATKGTRALLTALTMAFQQEETRGHLRMNVVAFCFTGGAMVVGVLVVGAMIALPAALAILGGSSTGELLVWLRWPALAALFLLWLGAAYRYGPARQPAHWRLITPGSVVATVIWLAGSGLFSWSVAKFGRFADLDGSLAAILTFLLWFLLSAYAVVLGAELDAEIERVAARSVVG